MSVAFPPCPECDGTGKVYRTGLYMGATRETLPCPSCGGRGVLITDELVEAGAAAMYLLETETDWRSLQSVPSRSYAERVTKKYRALARAGLVAVVEKLKENQ